MIHRQAMIFVLLNGVLVTLATSVAPPDARFSLSVALFLAFFLGFCTALSAK